MIYTDTYELTTHQLLERIDAKLYVIRSEFGHALEENEQKIMSNIIFASAGLIVIPIRGFRDNNGATHIFGGIEYIRVIRDFLEDKIVIPGMKGEWSVFSRKKFSDLPAMNRRKILGSISMFRMEALDYQAEETTINYFINNVL